MRKIFPNFFGNEDTKLRLCDAITRGTLPHALLITGPRGSGKHTLAVEIAAAMNCEARDSAGGRLPCGECNRCKRIYGASFPDLRILSRSAGKATIGVEELREFREDMFLSPSEAAYKIYIIEDAELMTAAAQNALLKVLEEPPSAVHIILLAAEADKMLSTIKSRTQAIATEIFEYGELFENVMRLSPYAKTLSIENGEKLKAILLSANGVIGDALSRLDEGKIAEIEGTRGLIFDFIKAIPKKAPFSALYNAVNAFPTKREELRQILEQVRGALRDMIAARVTEKFTPTFFLSVTDAQEAAGAIGKRRLIIIFDIITSALSDIDKNVIIQPLLTDIAVKIKEA